MRNKEEKVALILGEFDEFYRKEKGKRRDEEILERFFARYPDLREEISPYLSLSLDLQRALGKKRMPKEREERVWQRIEKKMAEMKREVPVCQRSDLLLLLLFEPNRRGIRGITRIMKYLFLLLKEKRIDQMVEGYYQFALHKYGPFSKELYEDLETLQKEGKIEKVKVRRKVSPLERDISEFFEEEGWSIEYRLTEEGLKFVKGLLKKGGEMEKAVAEIKGRYRKYPLVKLLEHIYETYPEYQENSVIWKKIRKFIES